MQAGKVSVGLALYSFALSNSMHQVYPPTGYGLSKGDEHPTCISHGEWVWYSLFIILTMQSVHTAELGTLVLNCVLL